MTLVQDRLIAAIADFFVKAGLSIVDVPILQPAEPFLDSVGEDLRRRIFMTENEHGEQLCLRPEFTIPVCLAHIKANKTLPHRYAYLGEVFRQRRLGQNSFYQAGIEDLGEGDDCKADATSLKSALDLLRTIAPSQNFQILTGDHGLFDAVLSQLGLSKGWQQRLSGCFGNKPRLRAVLQDLSNPPPLLSLPSDIAQALADDNEQLLTEILESQIYGAGLPLHFSRSAGEIAQRLREKAALIRQPLSKRRLQELEEFLGLHLPLSQASHSLAAFARKTGFDLEAALAKFDARILDMRHHDLDIEQMDYDAAFGRPLDYYTGFIYEIRINEMRQSEQILAGGGRYDHLLHLLGSHAPIPAVGFSLWLDRLESLVI